MEIQSLEKPFWGKLQAPLLSPEVYSKKAYHFDD